MKYVYASTMKTQSIDTHPKAEERLISLLKQKSIPQRISQSLTLTSLTLHLSKRAIARANPGKSKTELGILFVKYHYGEDLSIKVARHIQNSKYETK